MSRLDFRWGSSDLVRTLFVSLLLALVLSGIAAGQSEPDSTRFENATQESGLEFVHHNGALGRKYLVETMGAGVGFLDFDRDGLDDIYLIQSGPHDRSSRTGNALYRNLGNGRFKAVPQSGLEDIGYGMGCTFGDYDNDGWVDVFVTNFGSNRLFRNRGDGTFEDRTSSAGIEGAAWSVSAAFADIDGDGWLDLYVGNYLEFSYSNHVECGDHGFPSYCHPDVYDAAPNVLYRNNGDGTFQEVTESRGLIPLNPEASKTLGVLFFDMDSDRDLDLYIANDSTANFLFENQGNGMFMDVSLLSGTAYNINGKTEAGMGVDAADVDGDVLPDLIVTHLDFETNTLYANRGAGSFVDATETLGVGGPSRTRVGFGVSFGDFNSDRWIDLFVANGHVIATIERQNPSIKHAQPNQLLLNRGGRFQDASDRIEMTVADVSRGSAVGDYDSDGDLDILYSNNAGGVQLLKNQRDPDRRWIQFALTGKHCNRSAIGARVEVRTASGTQFREIRSGSGYGSQNSMVAHFGLGEEALEQVSIRWPCGRVQVLDSPEPGRRHGLVEPAGTP